MFRHTGADAPEGSLAHSGYMLYLAELRLHIALRKAILLPLAHWLDRFA